MRYTAVAFLIVLAALDGCSAVRPTSPQNASAARQPVALPAPAPARSDSQPPPVAASPPATAPAPTVEPTPTARPGAPEATPASGIAGDRPTETTASVATSPGRTSTTATVSRPAAPTASRQSTAAVTSAASAAPRTAAAPQPPPALDLASLEQQLRDTRAIGLFTKLSLKNQVDELLGQFRAYHRGDNTVSPSQLRQRYDGLLMKLLSVLQDGDPPLAAQIWSSREAIWGVLTDPAKFEKI